MKKYKVIVVGGGPAGMMAAGRAGELGASTLLLEKNKILGKKLLITGQGRCNLTNAQSDLKSFINQFGPQGKFLYHALFYFGPKEIINFFEKLGVKIKIERGQRVFPFNDRAEEILKALIKYLKKSSVEINLNKKVVKVVKNKDYLEKIILSNKQVLEADNFIFCPGGKSYPSTGSTGEAYQWLTKLGHQISPLFPSLTPLLVKEKIVKELEGLSLKNVSFHLFQNNKKINSRFGEAIFTAQGLSGPIVLDLSRDWPLNTDNLMIKIDFKPALDYHQLDQRIQKDFQQAANKLFKNSLNKLLPQKLIPVIIKLSQINPEKRVNLITREQRKKIVHLLKEFPLKIKGLGGYDQAIITRGGVNLKEIDPNTMKSKIIKNLYLAGEILDLDGPTGGYNLQVCWSTGYLAGENAAKK